MEQPGKQGLYDPRNEHDACGVGFVANIKGAKSHAIVRQGLSILVNLDHRGAVGADPLVGDGAGCMIQIPDALIRDWASKAGKTLPAPGHYAIAMCFLPQDEAARAFAIARFEHFIKVEGQSLIGWRDVPVDLDGLGKTVILEARTGAYAPRAIKEVLPLRTRHADKPHILIGAVTLVTLGVPVALGLS